ncbi:MAG: hypothetical protein ACREV4_16685, partial [Gammaproteobacteria bacterium]
MYSEIHEDSEHRRNAGSRAQQIFSQALRSSAVSGRQDGIVLVIILWATVLLSVIMGGLVLAMRTEIRLAVTQSAQ